MKQAKLLFLLITALAFASCRPTARQAVADAEQSTDSTEAVTSADTLRLVITDKHLSQTDSLIRRTLKFPVDSIVVEMMNDTDSTCMTGEAYAIEQRVIDEWTVLPIKPRKDGAVYAFNDIGYELAPHSTCLFTIYVNSDKYDFERGQEYRIVKEFFTQHPPVHYLRRFRQIRLRARTGIPHRQRVLQEREEGTAKRLLLFFI